jgi:predicted metal-dependent HD superfamily phosphohydrolase
MAKQARWGRLQDLFDHVPLGDEAKERLFDEMSLPRRHYHSVAHLEALWRRHRLYSASAGFTDPEIDKLVACAIAYHDSVYDMSRSDNEERSAKAWLRASAGSSLDEDERQWVAQTIRATKDHLAYRPDPAARAAQAQLRERVRAWVLDLDLTPLGVPAEEFDRNTHRLRLEAAAIRDAQWFAGMSAFRQRFLEAPRIYRTPELGAVFEAAARRNLTRSLPGEAPSPKDG